MAPGDRDGQVERGRAAGGSAGLVDGAAGEVEQVAGREGQLGQWGAERRLLKVDAGRPRQQFLLGPGRVQRPPLLALHLQHKHVHVVVVRREALRAGRSPVRVTAGPAPEPLLQRRQQAPELGAVALRPGETDRATPRLLGQHLLRRRHALPVERRAAAALVPRHVNLVRVREPRRTQQRAELVRAEPAAVVGPVVRPAHVHRSPLPNLLLEPLRRQGRQQPAKQTVRLVALVGHRQNVVAADG
mmetsp:Transcript_14520/g.47403  ORF Transcript_14520/g.47403 Transcript_14520/m.47403 type:complete len:244 (+) Transcript_14520:463-1194(+)